MLGSALHGQRFQIATLRCKNTAARHGITSRYGARVRTLTIASIASPPVGWILLHERDVEVSNEAGGMASVKRTVLRSEDFSSMDDLEAAAIGFIRDSNAANAEALESYLPNNGTSEFCS